jgi:hypothetical protein
MGKAGVNMIKNFTKKIIDFINTIRWVNIYEKFPECETRLLVNVDGFVTIGWYDEVANFYYIDENHCLIQGSHPQAWRYLHKPRKVKHD